LLPVPGGVSMVTRKIGSSKYGAHCASPSLIAIRPAVRKAISELSTVWNEPSISRTAQSTTGKPSGPFSIASRIPASTAGMYCRGITPPVILSSNTKPSPRSSGRISIVQSPYWPCPPDCFLCRPRCVAPRRIDSL